MFTFPITFISSEVGGDWYETPMYFAGDGVYATGYPTDGQAHMDVANGKAGSFVAKFKGDNIGAVQYLFATSSGRMQIGLNSSNAIVITVTQELAPTTDEMLMYSPNGTYAADTWYTIMASWDGTGLTGPNVNTGMAMYNVDTDILNATTTVSQFVVGDTDLSYNRYDTAGTPCTTCDLAIAGSTSGANLFAGCIAAIAFAPVDMDFADPAQRRKVCDEFGQLTDPGTLGNNWFDGEDAGILIYDYNESDQLVTHGKPFVPANTPLGKSAGTSVTDCVSNVIYIDPSIGATNGGIGTQADPLGDISDATIASDSVYLFKRGEQQEFTGTGNMVSFTGLSHIKFGAYGSGASPIMNGLADIRGYTWTPQGGDVYTTPAVATGSTAIGDTYTRQRVFINRVGQAQATDEYFAANGVDATYPVYWDGTLLWLYYAASAPSSATELIETILDRIFFTLGTGDDITMQDIDVYGMRVVADTLQANLTNLTFDKFRNYYGHMNRSAITLVGTGSYKIAGFKFINGSKLDMFLQPNEQPNDATTPENNTSFGSNDGISLLNNVGSTTGGTLGEITISDFVINGFGHTAIRLISAENNAANNVCIRNCLVENGVIDGTNANHSRGFAVSGYECNSNVIRDLKEIHTRSVSKASGENNDFYNIIYDSPLEDLSPSRGTDHGGGIFPDNSLKYSTEPDTYNACGGNHIFNITFYNSQNAPFHGNVGAMNNVSSSDPITIENILFVECSDNPTDSGSYGACIFESGSNFSKADGLIFNEIIAYNSTVTPHFRVIDETGTGQEVSPTTWMGDTTAYNATNIEISDPDIDGNFMPSNTGSAYNAGADTGIDHDYYGNPRPYGAAYDIGAVEYTP